MNGMPVRFSLRGPSVHPLPAIAGDIQMKAVVPDDCICYRYPAFNCRCLYGKNKRICNTNGTASGSASWNRRKLSTYSGCSCCYGSYRTDNLGCIWLSCFRSPGRCDYWSVDRILYFRWEQADTGYCQTSAAGAWLQLSSKVWLSVCCRHGYRLLQLLEVSLRPMVLQAVLNNFAMGVYGIGFAAVGMLSTLGVSLATDAFALLLIMQVEMPKCRNFQKKSRERTDALDGLGNTTLQPEKVSLLDSQHLQRSLLWPLYGGDQVMAWKSG